MGEPVEKVARTAGRWVGKFPGGAASGRPVRGTRTLRAARAASGERGAVPYAAAAVCRRGGAARPERMSIATIVAT